MADAAAEEAAVRFVRQRRIAWTVGGVVLLFAAAAVASLVMGRSASLFAAASAATALLGFLTAAVAQIHGARTRAAEIMAAGRAGMATLDGFTGRTAEKAARAVASHRQNLLDEQRAARSEAARLRTAAERVRRQAQSDHIAAVMGQLPTVTEYREQLSLVTRTRDRFDAINKNFDSTNYRVVIAIDDLDRCAAEKVVQVLEAVHLLFNFEMFVVLLAVDTRWLDQSLRIRYHQLLGEAGGAAPSDYLEKIIQIPVRLMPLDENLVRKMITGLTGRPLTDRALNGPHPPTPNTDPAPNETGSAPAPQPDTPKTDAGANMIRNEDASGKGAAPTRLPHARASRRRLPAKVLEITEEEAAAMSAVAPLVGTTPRTVKRFVNTYRLLKARVKDPGEFDHPRGGIGDHEVVAFLLAVITGQPAEARALLAAFCVAPANGTLESAITEPAAALPLVHRWVMDHPLFGNAPSHRFAEWAPEVTRFSFVPVLADGTPI